MSLNAIVADLYIDPTELYDFVWLSRKLHFMSYITTNWHVIQVIIPYIYSQLFN